MLEYSICSSKSHNNKRLELEFAMQPAGGFSGNLVEEEMSVGLGAQQAPRAPLVWF